MEALDVDIFASESLGISEILVAAFLSPKTGKKLLADACRLSVEVFRYGPLHTLLQGQCNLAFCFQLQGHKLSTSSASSR
jgi:hypothetical protein